MLFFHFDQRSWKWPWMLRGLNFFFMIIHFLPRINPQVPFSSFLGQYARNKKTARCETQKSLFCPNSYPQENFNKMLENKKARMIIKIYWWKLIFYRNLLWSVFLKILQKRFELFDNPEPRLVDLKHENNSKRMKFIGRL